MTVAAGELARRQGVKMIEVIRFIGIALLVSSVSCDGLLPRECLSLTVSDQVVIVAVPTDLAHLRLLTATSLGVAAERTMAEGETEMIEADEGRRRRPTSIVMFLAKNPIQSLPPPL
jgi:hypothetical protein